MFTYCACLQIALIFCSEYLSHSPGCIITPDKLSSLVAEAWPKAFTPVNILAGFKKSGIYPLNPGEVTDRQIGPAKTLQHNTEVKSNESECLESLDALFSPQKILHQVLVSQSLTLL